MRNIKIVCSFLLFFTINIMSAYATPNLYFNPPTIYTVPGRTYSVNVNVKGVNDLYGYEFKVKWNKDILTLTDAPLSANFGYYLVGKAETNNAEGYYYLIYSARNPITTGLNGDYTLVTLKFQVLQETTCQVRLEGTKLSDSNAQPISHTVTNNNLFIPLSKVGGGCPTLFTYDGKEYVKERKASIHSQPGIDTVDDIALTTKPAVVDGNYLFQLKETTLPEHSYIDSVRLFVTDSEGKKEVELVSAKHSKYGDVTEALAKSDDKRTDTQVLDEIKLKFAVPKLKGEANFTFEIEGYNPASDITNLKGITGLMTRGFGNYKLDITSILDFFKNIFGIK